MLDADLYLPTSPYISQAVMLEASAWRKHHLGAEHALTHGAAYDVGRVRRARAFAATMAAPTAAPAAAAAAAAAPAVAPAEAAVATGAEAAAEVGGGGVGGGGVGGGGVGGGGAAPEKSVGEAVSSSAAAAASAAAARSSRVAAALDAMQSVAADLDASWMAGLQRLCAEAGEAAHKWAEHINMLASVAQLHKDWAEAALLFRLANPTLQQLHAEEGLEYAELLNSEGECLLELGCHHLAAPLFDRAHKAVAAAPGSDDASCAAPTPSHPCPPPLPS